MRRNQIACACTFVAMTLLGGLAFSAPRADAALRSGLLCKDLKRQGVSYARAVAYWEDEGFPSRMDADDNGIPCETVYSAAAVKNFWGTQVVKLEQKIPRGLLCRDLKSRGLSFGEAYAYWVLEGFPSRMDADGNLVPCETVYAAAEVKQYFRR